MKNTPLVSIICLCYNHSKFLVESLNSVLNQTYPNIELIIVDDFSTDDSVNTISNWLLNYPSIKFIKNKVNLGNTKSFNYALQSAKGEYIIDLAADDILLPDCVAKQVDKFSSSSYKNLGIVYGNTELIDEKRNFISYFFDVDEYKKVIESRTGGDEYKMIITGGKNSMCSVSAMIKKSVFDTLQGYDETLAYEDLDFWIRVSRHYEFDFIDEILIQKRVVANSLGTDFFKKNDSKAKKINYSTYLILKKAIAMNKTREENKAILKRIHFETILAYKTSNMILMIKYIVLEIKLRFTIC